VPTADRTLPDWASLPRELRPPFAAQAAANDAVDSFVADNSGAARKEQAT
jgi:hypothetical protein